MRGTGEPYFVIDPSHFHRACRSDPEERQLKIRTGTVSNVPTLRQPLAD